MGASSFGGGGGAAAVTSGVFVVATAVFSSGAFVSLAVLLAAGISGREFVFVTTAAGFSFFAGSAAGVDLASFAPAGLELASVFVAAGSAGVSGIIEAILSFSTST